MSKKNPIALILVLWAAGLGAAGQFAKVSVSFEALGSVYPVSDTYLGLIVSVISVMGIIFGLTAAQFVSSIGFRKMLLGALLLGGVLSAIQATLPPYWVLMLSRTLEGITHLAITIAAPTLIAVLSSAQNRAFFMALWSTFFSVAFATMAWFGPQVIQAFGPGSLFALHAGYMAVIGAVLYFWLPKHAVATQAMPSASEIIQRHIRAYRSPREFAPALGWLFYTLTFVSVLTLLPPHVTEAQRTTLIPLLPLASIVSSLTVGALLLRFIQAYRLIQIGFAIGAAAAIALLMGIATPIVYISLFAALGLVQSSSFAAIPQLNKTADSQALANGGMSQMGNLGNSLGTPIMLVVIGWHGFPGLAGMLLVCFLGGILAHSILAQQRLKQL